MGIHLNNLLTLLNGLALQKKKLIEWGTMAIHWKGQVVLSVKLH